jgi:hypothetical protein
MDSSSETFRSRLCLVQPVGILSVFAERHPHAQHNLSAILALNPLNTRSRASRLAKHETSAIHFRRRPPLVLQRGMQRPFRRRPMSFKSQASDRTMADKPPRRCDTFVVPFTSPCRSLPFLTFAPLRLCVRFFFSVFAPFTSSGPMMVV